MNKSPATTGGRLAALGAVALLLLAVALPTVLRKPAPADIGPGAVSGGSGSAAAPRVFRFYQEYPHTLDPARSADSYSAGVIAQIYSPLVGLTSDLEPTPQLAQSWTISKDGRRYVFDIRPGVAFHNGREVTAADLAFSLTRLFREPFRSEGLAANYLDAIAGVPEFVAGKADTIAGIRALDRHRLEIILSRPYGSLLHALALDQTSAVPREILETHGPDGLESHPVGTGPFHFVRREKERSVVLAAHDPYFMGRAAIDSLIFYAPPGNVSDVGADALLDGRATLSLLPSHRVEEFRARSGLVVLRWQDLSLSFIGMNASIPPLDDARVRRAVLLAMDRDAMLQAQPEGRTQALGILPPGIPGYTPTEKIPERNVPAARALLSAAGYGRKRPLPPITLWTSISSARGRQIDSIMVRSLADAGITVNVRYESWTVLDRVITHRKAAMFGLAWVADIPDPESFLRSLAYSSSATNYFRYRCARVDSLLDEARNALNTEARAAHYHQAELEILKDAPFVPLTYTVSFIGMRDDVIGLEMNPLGISTLAMEKLRFEEPTDGRTSRHAAR